MGFILAWRVAIRHRQWRHLPPHNDYLRLPSLTPMASLSLPPLPPPLSSSLLLLPSLLQSSYPLPTSLSLRLPYTLLPLTNPTFSLSLSLSLSCNSPVGRFLWSRLGIHLVSSVVHCTIRAFFLSEDDGDWVREKSGEERIFGWFNPLRSSVSSNRSSRGKNFLFFLFFLYLGRMIEQSS